MTGQDAPVYSGTTRENQKASRTIGELEENDKLLLQKLRELELTDQMMKQTLSEQEEKIDQLVKITSPNKRKVGEGVAEEP